MYLEKHLWDNGWKFSHKNLQSNLVMCYESSFIHKKKANICLTDDFCW